MDDAGLFDLYGDDAALARARADVMGRRAQGLRNAGLLIRTLTGERDPTGGLLSQQGQALQQQLGGAAEARPRMPLLQAQTRLAQQNAQKAQQENDALQNPAARAVLSRTLGTFMPELANDQNITDAPTPVLQQLLGPAERAFAAREAAASRRELARLRASTGGSGLLSGPVKQDDVNSIADAIEQGTQPPDWKALYKFGAPLRAELSRRGVNVARLQTDWGAIQKNVSALNSTQQTRLRQAISKAGESLGNIEGLYGEWTQLAGSNFPIFNKASLAASKQLPGRTGEVARALEMNIADLTAELGAAYMGGNTPTEHALALAAKNLSADWGPGQFQEAVKQARKNLGFASNAIVSSTPIGVGADSPYLRPGGAGDRGPGPAAEHAPAAATPQGAPAAGPARVSSKAERDALPAGAQYIGPDGKTYTKR